MKKLLSVILIILCMLSLYSCSAMEGGGWMNSPMEGAGAYAPNKDMFYDADGQLKPEIESDIRNDLGLADDAELSDEVIEEWINNNYGYIIENQFIKTADENISTFSADVDTASYTYFRKLFSQGYDWTEIKNLMLGSVRSEEMINYFTYDYNMPKEGELFGVDSTIAPCPWNPNTYLLTIGLATERLEISKANNLVFLIDVSGSMYSEDKLGLLKEAFGYLVPHLDENDTVSIVTYSGAEKVVLKGANGAQHNKIMKAVNSLKAGGSTNGQAGLQKAYSLAEDYFIEGGNNRIIMASDGDLNVGISSAEELKKYVEGKRENGVYLSTMGFGYGNYRDANMEALADNGNGVYYYIDSSVEAEKIFGSEIMSSLYTVAEDVKIQLEFNEAAVESYRLIGYENRVMNNEDFDDDTKDAGELGAGHRVTVCYEIVLTDFADAMSSCPMQLNIRYKDPGDKQSKLNTYGIGGFTDEGDDDFKFVSAVLQFSMLMRDSKFVEGVTLEDVSAQLEALDLSDDEYKQAFADMVKKLADGTEREHVKY